MLLAFLAATDSSLQNFLLVGGRRDDDGRSFDLPETSSSKMRVNQINVSPLDISGTTELVATAVGTSLDDATELAVA